jgi:hypothetical protein
MSSFVFWNLSSTTGRCLESEFLRRTCTGTRCTFSSNISNRLVSSIPSRVRTVTCMKQCVSQSQGITVGASQHSRLLSFSAKRSIRQTVSVHFPKTSQSSASVSAAAVHEPRTSPSQESLLRQRYIYVQTNRDRWEEIPNGVMFDVAYLDSSPDGKTSKAVPTIVSLHSVPGSFHDLQPVLKPFVKLGCRVICPAFPGEHMYAQ